MAPKEVVVAHVVLFAGEEAETVDLYRGCLLRQARDSIAKQLEDFPQCYSFVLADCSRTKVLGAEEASRTINDCLVEKKRKYYLVLRISFEKVKEKAEVLKSEIRDKNFKHDGISDLSYNILDGIVKVGEVFHTIKEDYLDERELLTSVGQKLQTVAGVLSCTPYAGAVFDALSVLLQAINESMKVETNIQELLERIDRLMSYLVEVVQYVKSKNGNKDAEGDKTFCSVMSLLDQCIGQLGRIIEHRNSKRFKRIKQVWRANRHEQEITDLDEEINRVLLERTAIDSMKTFQGVSLDLEKISQDLQKQFSDLRQNHNDILDVVKENQRIQVLTLQMVAKGWDERQPEMRVTDASESDDSTNSESSYISIQIDQDENADWNEAVSKSKYNIDKYLKKIWQYAENPSQEAPLLEIASEQRVVVTLDFDLDLKQNLNPAEKDRIRKACRKIEQFLKKAGVDEKTLNEEVFLNSFWRGSLNILLQAHEQVFELLYSQWTKSKASSGPELNLGCDDDGIQICSLAPLFLVKTRSGLMRSEIRRAISHVDSGPLALMAGQETDSSQACPLDVLLYQEDNSGITVFVPNSLDDWRNTLKGGVGCLKDGDEMALIPEIRTKTISSEKEDKNEIKVGSFTSHSGDIKHYAIVPGNLVSSAPHLESLMRFWQLPRPKIILEMSGSAEEITTETKKRIIREESQRSSKSGKFTPRHHDPVLLQRIGGGDVSDVPEEDYPDAEWFNRYMERKKADVLASVVLAADMTQSWILCHGSPTASEKEVEEAIDRTRSAPTILVVDDMMKYDLYKEFWKELRQKTTPMNVATLGQGSDWVVDFSEADSEYAEKLPWLQRGTHFIFSEHQDEFDPEYFGTHVSICMYGSTRPIIREAMIKIRPCLVCDGSGGESQGYAQLIKEIHRLEKEFRDQHDTMDSLDSAYTELRRRLRERAWALQERATVGVDKDLLTLADVLETIDMYCENPRVFNKIVHVVDPINDNREDVVKKKLILSVAMAAEERAEIGAGNADIVAVESAWRLHLRLERRKRDSWRRLLRACYSAAAIVAVLAAVLHTYLEDEHGDEFDDPLRWTALALAVLLVFCSAILDFTSCDFNTTNIAQARIVSEIFQFRLRTGKYVLPNFQKSQEEEEGLHRRSENVSTAMHSARSRFSREIEYTLHAIPLSRNDFGRLDDNTKRKLHKHTANSMHIVEEHSRRNVSILYGVCSLANYVELRLLPLLMHLEREESNLRRRTMSLLILSFMSGIGAVVLAAVDEVVWVPLAVAGTLGLQYYTKAANLERRLKTTAAAARELFILEAGYRSLEDLEKYKLSTKETIVSVCEDIAFQCETLSAIKVDKTGMELALSSAHPPAAMLAPRMFDN